MSVYADPNISKFFSTNTFEKRKSISDKIITDYSGYVPIIVGRAEIVTTPLIKKHKYVVSREMSFGNFIIQLKSNMENFNEKTNIFVFFPDNTLVPINEKISYLYDKYKNNDGFLYITYSVESTFG
jgi:GABA(A) receptor-associated protein